MTFAKIMTGISASFWYRKVVWLMDNTGFLWPWWHTRYDYVYRYNNNIKIKLKNFSCKLLQSSNKPHVVLVQRHTGFDDKEYVAGLIGLYKNDGAVSRSGIDFLSIHYATLLGFFLLGYEILLGRIWLWADIDRNCNIFFGGHIVWGALLTLASL